MLVILSILWHVILYYFLALNILLNLYSDIYLETSWSGFDTDGFNKLNSLVLHFEIDELTTENVGFFSGRKPLKKNFYRFNFLYFKKLPYDKQILHFIITLFLLIFPQISQMTFWHNKKNLNI